MKVCHRYCCELGFDLAQIKIQAVHLKPNIFNQLNNLYQFRIRNNWIGRNSVKQNPDSTEDPYSGGQIILDCFKSNPSLPCDYTCSTNPLLLMHKKTPKPGQLNTWLKKNCLSNHVPALIFKVRHQGFEILA